MTIAPELADLVDQLDAAAAAQLVGWADYRLCPVCRAAIGAPCVALNGRVAGGQPDGVLTPLTVPHAARKRRQRR
jgi:hypothetical protein